MVYTPAARLWRINRGWRRRKDKNQLGFYINPITGTWSKKDDPNSDEGDKAVDEPLLDKVPNQRIVPFVEDHRNLLILTPLKVLSLESMATLQAALKRGIEMIFQIEESEMVAEPLPTQDERKSLMFYESAEGGAGVLTRLANEPHSLAEVASAALKLMHFSNPEGLWSVEALEGLEQKHNGLSVCEAGCYQCLLSYFNQPDHDNINRRNTDALELLVALANAEVCLSSSAQVAPTFSVVAEVAAEDSTLSGFLMALDQAKLKRPDASNVPVLQGAAIAAAQYKTVRTLVFLQILAPDLKAALHDKGWQVLEMADAARWPKQFAEYSAVFGGQEEQQ